MDEGSYSQSSTTHETLLSWFSRFTLWRRNHMIIGGCHPRPPGGEEFTEVKDISPSSHTHICSLWSRESHHSWLTTSSQRTGGAGATILTRGTLLEQAGKIYYFKFIHILNVFVCMLIMIFHVLIIIMLAVSMTKKEGRQQPESYDLYYSYTLNYTTVPPVYYDRTKTTISVFCLDHLK